MNVRDFFRHAATYGLANLLLQAGGFVLLPVYTRFLTKPEYGILEILGRIAETVGTFLFIGGLRQALLTFYQQNRQPQERERLVSSTLALLFFGCVLVGGLVLGFSRPLSQCLGSTQDAIAPNLFRLAVIGILLEPFTLIPLSLIQSRVESLTFVIITLSQFVLRVTLCVILVAWLHWGVEGVLTATAVTSGAYGVVLSFRELARAARWPDWGQTLALLRFALPFLPGGVCFFVLHHGDRFFLLRWAGEEAVGTYALGYKLAMVVTTFSLNPLYMVWSVHLYEVARSPAAPRAFGVVFTRIMAAYVLVGLAVGLFQDEIITLLGGERYADAAPVVAPVLLACFFQAGASLMDSGFYVRRRTGLKLGITLTSTAVMVALYFALIPTLKGTGAALATLLGFAFHAAFTWWMTQRIFPVRYEWGRLVVMLSLALGLWFASRALPESAWVWPVKVGLWALWPLTIWHVGLISALEKQYAGSFRRQAVAFLADGVARLRAVRLRLGDLPTPPISADGDELPAPPVSAPEEEAA
jgi:O-antigen/teichoic acid export membrane protein